MASIARGLETGVNLGFKIDEALRRKQMRDEFEAARKEKEFGRYSQEKADKMRAESEMVDASGRPLYRYTIAPGSTQYTREELSYPEAAPTAAVANLTPEQEAYLRNIEAAKDLSGRPYYSVDRGEGGLATVRARPVSAGGGFEHYDPYQAPMGRIRYLAEETAAYTEDGRPPVQVFITPEEIKAREAERAELLRQYGSTAEFRPTAGLVKQAGPSVGVPTGAAETYSPDVVEYLGKTYAQGLTPGKLSEKQKNAALMDKYAEILSAYDPVEGMKFKIMADKERREQESFDINKALTEFRYKELKRGEKLSEAEDNFYEAVQRGEVDFNTDWNKISKDFGIRPDRLNAIAEGVLNLEKGQITRMLTAVDKAMIKSQGNLDKFLQYSLDDKDYDPTSHLVKRQGPNGGIIIDTVETLKGNKAGKVISSTQEFPTAAEAMEFTYNTLRNPGVAAQTALKNKQIRADISEKEATAEYKRSAADFYSRRDTGGLSRNTERTEQDIVARLRENREAIKDIDAELEKLGSRKDEDSIKRREALIRQRNALNQENEELRNYSRFDGSGGLAPPPKYKAGDVVSYVDESGKKVNARFKGGENKRENWEVITDAATAASTTAKPPSGKGITEKEYESWIEDKLIGAFTSRTLQLRSIAKDHPNPQIRAAAQRMLEIEKNKPSPPGVDMPM